ncbi:RapZ C-terminal domain-containing protein [Kitasatospora griseola]|uniref:RapZ C-terminal domain-containing protein n=1 Tax=Kitasatospora griseola TaxID=2064 RepID=UPI003427C677
MTILQLETAPTCSDDTVVVEADDRLVQVQVLSFGFGHDGPVPEADILLDLRRAYRNPHTDPAMRQLTGFDAPVAAHVDATPGIGALVRHTVAAVVDLVAEVGVPQRRLIRVAAGCVGGRHRSVRVARLVRDGVRAAGFGAEAFHLHVGRGVIQR